MGDGETPHQRTDDVTVPIETETAAKAQLTAGAALPEIQVVLRPVARETIIDCALHGTRSDFRRQKNHTVKMCPKRMSSGFQQFAGRHVQHPGHGRNGTKNSPS